METTPPKTERNEEIRQMRREGSTLIAIARKYNLSIGRVQRIVNRRVAEPERGQMKRKTYAISTYSWGFMGGLTRKSLMYQIALALAHGRNFKVQVES